MNDDTIYKVAAARHTLRRVAAAMEALVRRASGMTDLTLSHALVLVSLARRPICRQVDLKSLPGVAPPRLTRVLDELTIRGLVCRSRSSQDRRQVLLSLTNSGWEAASCFLTALDAVADNEWFGALEELGSVWHDEFPAIKAKHSQTAEGPRRRPARERRNQDKGRGRA